MPRNLPPVSAYIIARIERMLREGRGSTSSLYIARLGTRGLFKIGRARGPESRMGALKTDRRARGRAPTLLAVADGMGAYERIVLAHFDSARIEPHWQCEWFKPTTELVAFAEGLARGGAEWLQREVRAWRRSELLAELHALDVADGLVIEKAA